MKASAGSNITASKPTPAEAVGQSALDFDVAALEDARMSPVVVENVTKIFKGPKGVEIPAVKELNLTLEPGELLVLLGPSGCGKTTALRLIAGLEEPTSGTIKIDEKAVNSVAPKERDVAMVFQNHALYPHMTVRENMAFGLKLRGVATTEIEQRINGVAAILGLKDCLARGPAELSGGQHQRVALGRAMVRKPKVFLLDEPLSNLDAQLRAQLRREIAKMQKVVRAAMIYVTHDQTEAMALGDRVAVMKSGAIQQVAPPKELYRRPANRFVAGFIGSPPMNFFIGTLVKAGDTVMFQDKPPMLQDKSAGFKLGFTREASARLAAHAGREVILGIRPEDVATSSEQPDAPGDWRLEGSVEFVEALGPETHVNAMSEVGKWFVARMPGDCALESGKRVTFTFDMRKAHLFDAATEKRIE